MEYKVFFKSRVVVTIPDVLSETFENEEIYDLTNYRDDVSNGGQPPSGVYPHVSTLVVGTDAITNAPTTPYAESDAILETSGPDFYSVSDVISHIPPRPEMKTRTKRFLWSEVSGGGTQLYSFWEDLAVGWGAATTHEYV